MKTTLKSLKWKQAAAPTNSLDYTTKIHNSTNTLLTKLVYRTNTLYYILYTKKTPSFLLRISISLHLSVGFSTPYYNSKSSYKWTPSEELFNSYIYLCVCIYVRKQLCTTNISIYIYKYIYIHTILVYSLNGILLWLAI